MLHPLLRKQIESCPGLHGELSPAWTALLDCVSNMYYNHEQESAAWSREVRAVSDLADQYKQQLIQFSAIFSSIQLKIAQLLNENPAEKNHRFDRLATDELLGAIARLEQKVAQMSMKEEMHSRKIIDLESINKELDQFSYIVSHDLKAPLRAISNLSQWIEDDLAGLLNNQVKENMRLLRHRVVRLESLVNAILTYSKATKIITETEIADTGLLLKEVIDSLSIPAHIRIIKAAEQFPVIRTETVKLEQVFSNLLSNAIKYNDKDDGKIEVGFYETEEFCQFYVQDNGPGIEPQFQKKVFMIFQTLETKDSYESTGIGLSIVKKIIDEKGGKIWIESEKGKGARFVFTWPKIKTVTYQKA